MRRAAVLLKGRSAQTTQIFRKGFPLVLGQVYGGKTKLLIQPQ